jgi:hypothetical protein
MSYDQGTSVSTRRKLRGALGAAAAWAVASVLGAVPAAAGTPAPGAAPAPPTAIVVLDDRAAPLDAEAVAALRPATSSLLSAAGYRGALVHAGPASAGAALPGDAPAALAAGIAAYDALHFADAVTRLDEAAAGAVATGARGLTAGELADIFLFRAMALYQLGKPERAWDDFRAAALYAPGRALDPARFPPAAREQYTRAMKEATEGARAALEVAGPAGGRAFVDGDDAGPLPARVEGLPAGTHLVRVESPGCAPWVARVALAAPKLALEARPEPFPPALASATPGDLGRYATARGAALVVAVETLGAPRGGLVLRVVAVRSPGDAVLTEARVTLDAGTRADDLSAALGAALAPLLAATAGGPLTAPSAARPASRWRYVPWIVAGAAVVASGLTVGLFFGLRGPGVDGFHATLRIPRGN